MEKLEIGKTYKASVVVVETRWCKSLFEKNKYSLEIKFNTEFGFGGCIKEGNTLILSCTPMQELIFEKREKCRYEFEFKVEDIYEWKKDSRIYEYEIKHLKNIKMLSI